MLCGAPHIHEGREIWIYYNALRFRGPRELYTTVPDTYFEDESALVLAKLRLDGFVALHAEATGTVTTQPFLPNGGQLWVNVEAQTGEVRAEVLDATTGQIVPGYSADVSCKLAARKSTNTRIFGGR